MPTRPLILKSHLRNSFFDGLGDYSPMVAILYSIPGVSDTTVQTIVTVSGDDMSSFTTSGHLRAWAGVAVVPPCSIRHVISSPMAP